MALRGFIKIQLCSKMLGLASVPVLFAILKGVFRVISVELKFWRTIWTNAQAFGRARSERKMAGG